METVRNGSRWTGNSGDYFRVITVAEVEGKTWVHYRKESKDHSEEYSCYLGSFLHRFTEVQDEQPKPRR